MDLGNGATRSPFDIFPTFFPNLKKITFIMVDLQKAALLDPSRFEIMFRSEWSGVATDERMVEKASKLFEATKVKHPEWHAPVLEFRDSDAFEADPLGSFGSVSVPSDTKAAI